MDETATARRWYAEDLRCKTPVLRDRHIIDAFAAVPREAFLGPGPWRITPYPYQEPFITPDDHPGWLYHDVLVSIDPSRKAQQWDAELLGPQLRAPRYRTG